MTLSSTSCRESDFKTRFFQFSGMGLIKVCSFFSLKGSLNGNWLWLVSERLQGSLSFLAILRFGSFGHEIRKIFFIVGHA